MSLIKATAYEIRITNFDKIPEREFLQKMLEFAKYEAKHYALAYEMGDGEDPNPHCHFYLEDIRLDIKSLRAKIKKTYGPGNERFKSATLVRDNLKYLGYMLKHPKEFHHNLPETVIEQARLYDASVKMKKASRAVYDALHTLVSKEQNLGYNELVSIVINYYAANKLLYREFTVKSQIQTLAIEFIPRYKEFLIHKEIEHGSFGFESFKRGGTRSIVMSTDYVDSLKLPFE